MKRYWLITDTHFNHKKIIELCHRPKDYEKKIIKGLQQIPEKDVLIHLGDICIGQEREVHAEIIQPLKCKKWLIKGNHDHKSDNWYLEHGWDFVADQILLEFHKKTLLFSHYPLYPHNELYYYAIIHGHLHAKFTEYDRKRQFGDTNKLLALENTNYQPILLDTFLKTQAQGFYIPKN